MGEALQDIVFCSVLIALRFFVVGVAWTWFMPVPDRVSRCAWTRWLFVGARAALGGIVIGALLTLVLGQLGCYRSVVEYTVLGVLAVVGLLPAFRCSRSSLPACLRDAVPVMLVSVLGVIVIMGLPRRGEWLMGGWDPGVYISEGVALERTGTFYPSDPLLFDQLNTEERAVFTRGDEHRTERFPGVVIDAKRQRLSYEFFRLHPSLIAVLHRCGGITAALRGNTILGMFAVFVFCGMMLVLSGAPHALFASFVLMAQPLWLYHTHTPVSEMLHLLLMLGIGLLLPGRDSSRAATIWLAVLIMGMILNRFSFLPFAAMLIVALAWLDLERADRQRVWAERGWQWGAAALGAWVDWRVSPASLQGWSKTVVPVMLKVVAACAVFAVACDVAGSIAALRRRFCRVPRWVRGVMGWVCLALVAGLACYGAWGPQTKNADNLVRLLPFVGPVVCVYAVVGVWLMSHRKQAIGRVLGSFLFVLFGITMVVLVKKWVKDFYPWATRRYLANAIPMLAMLASYPLARLWEAKGRPFMGRGAAVALLLVLLGGGARMSWHAWSRVETRGLLHVLDAVAERIGDDDIVVVDTPTWGTPLKMVYGKEILNGKHMWRRKDAAQMQVGLAALARRHEAGRPIRFLTTTRTLGMDIYPVRVAPVTLDWESEESFLQSIDHSSRADDFEVRAKQNVFRLFTWHLSDVR